MNHHTLHIQYLFVKFLYHHTTKFGKNTAWDEVFISPVNYLYLRTFIYRIAQLSELTYDVITLGFLGKLETSPIPSKGRREPNGMFVGYSFVRCLIWISPAYHLCLCPYCPTTIR